MGKTLYQKIWDAHAITTREDGHTLLHVGRMFVHDGSVHAFEFLKSRNLAVRRPDQIFGTPDHGVSSARADVQAITLPEQRYGVEQLARNTKEFNILHFPLGDDKQGIVHVVGPEQGLTQPGMLLVCGDSHTSTHGALGAFGFGLGTSDIMHVLATQTTWQRRAKTMRININGVLSKGVTAKDVILATIAQIGVNGAVGHVIEYAGSTIRAMSIEQRLTICNMSIDSGARAGMVAPDDTTYAYLHGRRYSPSGTHWDRALSYWRTLPSDPDAIFDSEINVDATSIAPMVTWGNSPDDALSVDGCVPDPMDETDPERRASMLRALEYMGLVPGMRLTDIKIDQVFIGSCTNARIEDLRSAAAIAKTGKAIVPVLVVPGSTAVKRMAEAEGLDKIFRAAGFTWGAAGCSMCVGQNGDIVAAGKRCASTTNRNFVGRQGAGSRTHLMSPSMAAAAALTGHVTDLRTFGE